mgnify:CR=1 FL=1
MKRNESGQTSTEYTTSRSDDMKKLSEIVSKETHREIIKFFIEKGVVK